MILKRIFQRAYHLSQRVIREAKGMPKQWKAFGAKVALETFRDGLIPPGKSPRYIDTIGSKVDQILAPVVEKYRDLPEETLPMEGKIPIWCCWWQGEEQMPELVKLCHTRLKQMIPEDKAQLHLITLDNYREYVDIPDHILEKFEKKIITMTTMSDVLRFALLAKYGGYWLDATVFFTGEIPEEYFSGNFFCQRMTGNLACALREACRCNWCGFSMAGPKNSIVFRYMRDAFSYWWAHCDTIIDYVLIDYILWTGYCRIPAIRDVINSVPDNNEDIFEMYQVLNQSYSPDLLEKLTRRNVMHKLTYKIDLNTRTAEGELTLYGWLRQWVLGEE